jgi:hypothetical protein
MRGENLLLTHLALLDEPPKPETASAAERLEAELGRDLARDLVRSLTAGAKPDA